MDKIIQFDNLEILVKTEERKKQIIVKKHDLKTHDYKHLYYLDNNATVTGEVKEEEDDVSFVYQIPENYTSLADGYQLSRLDKLRLGMNIYTLTTLGKKGYAPLLHPDNIIYNLNLVLKVFYYGIEDQLPPYYLKEDYYVKAYKSLIISLFSKYSFENVIGSDLKAIKATPFLRDIVACKTNKEIHAVLELAYKEEKKRIEGTQINVSKRNHGLLKKLTIGFGVLLLGSLVLAGYLLLFKLPFDERMMASNEAFVARNYNDVIDILRNEKPEKLPLLNQYELAYAYLNGEALNDEQKEMIFNNLSLKAMPPIFNSGYTMAVGIMKRAWISENP